MLRIAGIAVVSALLVLSATACGGSRFTALACGAVRPVTPTRLPGAMGDGIAFGPLQLGIYPFRAGNPTKVLIGVVRRLRGSLTIRGRRCSDGGQLRFFYANGQLDIRGPGPPYATSVLERAGRASAHLKEPSPGARNFFTGYFFTGYFLFPTAGKYEVKLYRGSSVLDSAVIDTSE